MYLWPQEDRKRLTKFDHFSGFLSGFVMSFAAVRVRGQVSQGKRVFPSQQPSKSVGNCKFRSHIAWSQRRKQLFVNIGNTLWCGFLLGSICTLSWEHTWWSLRDWEMIGFCKKMTSLSRFSRISTWKSFTFTSMEIQLLKLRELD